MNLSGRKAGSRRRSQTRTASRATVFTNTQAQPGSSGPAPPPRNIGTANAAPAASSAYRPASNTNRSTPDSSARAPPETSVPIAGAKGPHTEKAATPSR